MAGSRVIVSLLTKEQEFQVMQAADAEQAAARAGLQAEVVYAKNNPTLQTEQLYRFVNAPASARPVAIIVQSVAGEGLPRVARDAAKAGIGWIVLNREPAYIEDLRGSHPHLPIAVVTTDQVSVGRIQARQLLALLPNGGNILYVEGPPDTSAAQQRLQAFQEATAGRKIDIKVLAGEWTEASSEKAMMSWMRLSSSHGYRLDLVAAQNDAMAIGARNAIAAGRPEWLRLPFTGCDGLVQGGQRLVDEGKLAATIILQSAAGRAIDLVANHLRTGTPSPARVTLPARPYPALPSRAAS